MNFYLSQQSTSKALFFLESITRQPFLRKVQIYTFPTTLPLTSPSAIMEENRCLSRLQLQSLPVKDFSVYFLSLRDSFLQRISLAGSILPNNALANLQNRIMKIGQVTKEQGMTIEIFGSLQAFSRSKTRHRLSLITKDLHVMSFYSPQL